jgi:hypothetical protein
LVLATDFSSKSQWEILIELGSERIVRDLSYRKMPLTMR